MRTIWLALVLLLAVTCPLVAGCGGGSSDGDQTYEEREAEEEQANDTEEDG